MASLRPVVLGLRTSSTRPCAPRSRLALARAPRTIRVNPGELWGNPLTTSPHGSRARDKALIARPRRAAARGEAGCHRCCLERSEQVLLRRRLFAQLPHLAVDLDCLLSGIAVVGIAWRTFEVGGDVFAMSG